MPEGLMGIDRERELSLFGFREFYDVLRDSSP